MHAADHGDVHPVYLNGSWVQTGKALRVINPATEEPVGAVAVVGRSQVAGALADAQRAWPGWRAMPAKRRGQFLLRVAAALERQTDDLARTITLENGKPLGQSRAEVAMAVDHLRWFAAEAERAYGRVVPSQSPGKRHLVVKSSIGVVGAISPWNFPLVLAVRKVAPALAAGCPVILKPASATPLSAVFLARAVHEAELPPGVFQLVAGPAEEIGAELLENPLCRKITFTGSTAVGRRLLRGAAEQIKKLSLELGGHAPVLVFADADLQRAVEGTLLAKVRNTGQSCIAANRAYVERPIYEKFVSLLAERAQQLKLGNGLEEGVQIGPLINREALDHALEQIEQARAAGARLLCGGKRWPGSDRGFFLEPTVLADVPADAQCMHEETFAPVLPVLPFDSEQQAVEQANASRYGLAAYVFTCDLARSWRLAEALEAGTICINDSVPATSPCPFGGLKQSGIGRELGCEGLDAFLEIKHISIGEVEP